MSPYTTTFGMDASYAEEKFIQAERDLALGSGAIKSRLIQAQLRFATLTKDDVPFHLHADFEEITRRLTTRPPLRSQFSENVDIVSDSVEQTLHFMKNKTAVAIAECILAMRYRLKEYNDATS